VTQLVEAEGRGFDYGTNSLEFSTDKPSGLGSTQPLTELSKVKGKAIPLQVWTCPEVSRRLRLPDFNTIDTGGNVVSPKHRPPLPPGNIPGTHFS
jgi:hypothetical protein